MFLKGVPLVTRRMRLKFNFHHQKATMFANSALCYVAAGQKQLGGKPREGGAPSKEDAAAIRLLKKPEVLESAFRIMKEWRQKRRLKKFNVFFMDFVKFYELRPKKNIVAAEKPPKVEEVAEEVEEVEEVQKE